MLNTFKTMKLFSLSHWLGNKPVFLFFCFFAFSHMMAQENLVPNGGFEEYNWCPQYDADFSVRNWYKPNSATTDYYNVCQTDVTNPVNVPNAYFGYQMPKDGDGFVGLFTYNNSFESLAEYIQIKMQGTLKECVTYKLEFWVSLANQSSWATNTISARLDSFPIFEPNPFGFELPPHIFSEITITDTVGWTKISGTYTANGGENYLTIGRFLDTLLYDNANVPHISFDCIPCFPLEKTCHYYIDAVSLTQITEELNEPLEVNVLTGNGDGINDFWYPNYTCLHSWRCEILNRWGNVIFEFSENENGWNGLTKTGEQVNDGVYFYRLSNNKQAKTGFIQLIR